MERILCFWLEPTDRDRRSLRRYRSAKADEPKCPGPRGYHNGHSPLPDAPAESVSRSLTASEAKALHSGWPTKCDHCSYLFVDGDEWQVFARRIYKRADTGEEHVLREAPAGAMWDAHWMSDLYKGEDGRCIVVQTPGGEWMVDSRASNCTMPNDNEHKCWVRHGTPPVLTVDKNGKTCAAGAGSIQCGNYHGFLRNGYLER